MGIPVEIRLVVSASHEQEAVSVIEAHMQSIGAAPHEDKPETNEEADALLPCPNCEAVAIALRKPCAGCGYEILAADAPPAFVKEHAAGALSFCPECRDPLTFLSGNAAPAARNWSRSKTTTACARASSTSCTATRLEASSARPASASGSTSRPDLEPVAKTALPPRSQRPGRRSQEIHRNRKPRTHKRRKKASDATRSANSCAPQLTLDGKSIAPPWRKPFDIISKLAPCAKEWAVQDSNLRP